MSADEIFIQAVRSQLRGDETPGEIERLVLAAGEAAELPAEQIEAIARRLCDRAEPPPVGPAAPPSVPRLLVDWGHEPEVGAAACPEFHVLCPGYRGRPRIAVEVDSRLDCPANSVRPQLDSIEAGYWSFHVPFMLTSGGEDCRRGRYLIAVRIAFPNAEPPRPRFFQGKIFLKLGQQEAREGRTLQIEGDGQALLNLHGRDLRSFGRIILKASERAVVNVQELLLAAGAETAASPRDEQAEKKVQFEYELKPDHDRDERTPRPATRFRERARLDKAALVLPSGLRILLLARQCIQLGRDRANDVVARFLPRGEENDARSAGISRRHLTIELTERGLRLADSGSTFGTTVRQEPLEGSELVMTAGETREIPIALAARASDPFQMQLRIFGASPALAELEELFSESLDTETPALWRTAQAAGISALRLRRITNLPDAEQYLALFRPVAVGSSPDSPLPLFEPGVEPVHARLLHLDGCFWLENASLSGRTAIHGEAIAKGELAPLVPGMELRLSDCAIRFEEYRQVSI